MAEQSRYSNSNNGNGKLEKRQNISLWFQKINMKRNKEMITGISSDELVYMYKYNLFCHSSLIYCIDDVLMLELCANHLVYALLK